MGNASQDKYISEVIAHFTDKQRLATEAVFEHDFVLYGGARGGGKSHWARWMNVILLIYWYKVRGLKHVRTGLFCESYPTLKDRQIGKIAEEFPRWLGELKDTQTEGLGFFLNEANGSGGILLRNLDDPGKYKSAEFAAVTIDQLEENTLDTFNIVRGSKRWPGIEHTKLIASANPGGIGHNFVKQYWIDRDFPPEMQQLAEQFKFIQALPADNPLLSKSYWDELNALPTDLRRAWVEGDWDIFSGQAFGQFRRERHVIAPRDLPTHWPRWRAIDWGYAKPFCCLWFAKDPDTERRFVYRELYETELTDKQQARSIIELTPKEEKIQYTFADPSMWTRKNMEGKVTTTADEYRDEGVLLTKADNDRMNGKRKIDRLLGNLPDGLPGAQIFENCTNLIRTLPALPYSKVIPEDVDTNAEDHAYDTWRYGETREVRQPAAESKPQRNPMQGLNFSGRKS